ncbi:hypothetical protein SLEP1_g6208 [Rubroshorea leprosula]|uniref:S-adenosyl-L-methionine-dependent methyltransferase n=1 Tax=Rubroshorea leprosula TaxID=152421 RepID=A0AAV5I2K5_9ROSI|nr:hypothetical protein SLEP1_g6208 [Rubroshorea leprosula]
MVFTMSLNLFLLMAMVTTNIFSLYHLSSNLQFPKPTSLTHSPIPDHRLLQLHTIRATINHLTRHYPSSDAASTNGGKPSSAAVPRDLLLYSRLSSIASSCHNHVDLLHKYMSYTPFSICPHDSDLQETLILNGCHPLPRRRCFSKTPSKPPPSLPLHPFPIFLPDSSVIWSKYACKSFTCLSEKQPNIGFDLKKQRESLVTFSSELDLPIPQFMQIAKLANSVIRIGIDIGGGTGTFAAVMKELYNVTVLTTTMNINAPYNEAVALRGLVPLHVPLQQRLPVFDGVVDLVRCGRAVNRWIPLVVMEFMLYDVDRVLRGGGYLWLDRFFSRREDLEKVFGPMIGKLGYKKVKWSVANKTDSSGLKHEEVYLTALLQKPASK